jgi:hypothetical protein
MNKKKLTFDDAVQRLNSKKLEGLLEVSSLLSSLEFYGGEKSEVFQMLNNEKCRLFSEAIVSSKAASYKKATITESDLRYVLNAANSALDDPRLHEIVPCRPRDEREYDLIKFFSRMGNVQLRQQEIGLFSAVGRLLGILNVIPRRNILLFPEECRSDISQFVKDIPRVLGTSLRDLAVIYIVIYDWYRRVNDVAWKVFHSRPYRNRIKIQTKNKRQAEILIGLYACLPNVRRYLSFSFESLRDFVPSSLSETAFNAFMDLFARPMREIREEGKKPVYKHGVTGWHLSPLERYPVVVINSGTQGTTGREFIVPNVRTFIRSFPDVIHFTLQERFKNTYNEVRGLSQEVYLRLLLDSRMPYCTVIPETAYKTSMGEKKGPDLTIVDHNSSRLVAVESKARRVLAETRFTMGEDIFDTNFGPVYDTLLRLQEKIDYLYRGIPEYQDYQEELNSTTGCDPICVVIVGESVYMMNEIIRYRAKKEDKHPLRNFKWVYCVMSLDSFEMAVEIAAAENKPLSNLLDEFWIDSGTMELDSNMADSFRNRCVPKRQTFAESFILQEE